MFSKFWNDYLNITVNLMPILLDYKVDFYLNGHEHGFYYANYPYDQVPQFVRDMLVYGHESSTTEHLLQSYKCVMDQEIFFGQHTRYQEYIKGDAIHQVTTGATAAQFTPACLTRPSMGRFKFLNNREYGFSHVYVNDREFTVKFIAVDHKTMESREIYRVTVYNTHVVPLD